MGPNKSSPNKQKNVEPKLIGGSNSVQSKINDPQIIFSDVDQLSDDSGNESQCRLVDLRKPVQDTSKHPYNGICFLRCTFQNPQTKKWSIKRGSGIIIGLDTILTSLHNLIFKYSPAQRFDESFSDESSRKSQIPYVFAYKIQFFHSSMLNRSQSVGQGLRVVKFYYNRSFVDVNCKNKIMYDFAVLKLKPNKIIKKEHILKLNFSFDFNHQKNLGKSIMICGYPNSDPNPKKQQYEQYQQKENCNAKQMRLTRQGLFCYQMTTEPGNSGCPVLIETTPTQFQVIGVHKGSNKDINSQTGGQEKWNSCILLKTIKELNPNFDNEFELFSLEQSVAFAWKEIQVPKVTLDEAEEIQKAKIYLQTALFNQIKHRYEQSLKFYALNVDILTSKLGPGSVKVADSLNNIGVVHYNRGEYEQALQKYNQCLEIQTKTLGPGSAKVADTLNNIGSVHGRRGEYEEALQKYNQCLEIRTKTLGPGSVEVAATLQNIGIVHKNRGEYEQALKKYNKCLEIQTQTLGPESVEVADTLFNIGNVHYNRGEYEQALQKYNRCLEIRTKTLGPGSVEVAATLFNIGLVHGNRGEYEEALQKFNQCLEIRTKTLGPGSVQVAQTLKNIKLAKTKLGWK